MKRRRSRDDNGGQSLDSLLDTMANVVGILVVLVAVMQLAVGDAVDRIVEEGVREPATQAEVEAAEEERENLTEAITTLRDELEALPPAPEVAGMLLDEVQPLLDELKALAGANPMLSAELSELQEEIARRNDSVARRKTHLAQQKKRLVQLEALLENAPPAERPKVARLPDPRPPPKKSSQLVFFCRYGRIVPIETPAFLAQLYLGIEDALGENRPVVEEDRPWLENLFRKELFSSQNFYWKITGQSHRDLDANMVWRDKEAGEHAGDLRLEDNLLEAAIQGKDPKKKYVRFWVWSDSFEVYLEARYLAEAAGFDVAWTVIPSEKEVGVDLLGRGRTTRVMID